MFVLCVCCVWFSQSPTLGSTLASAPLTLGLYCDLFADVTPPQTAGYIEVTDLQAKKLRYIPVPSAESLSPYTAWISAISDTDALLAEWDKSSVVTVDMGGRVRLWETGLERLQQSLMEWRNMIGQDSDKHVQVSLKTFLSQMNLLSNAAIKGTSGLATPTAA